MIDPLESLAFSVHANPGVYALLLGSGVSRSAMVPTGWEITLDLIRRLAALRGESCEPDAEAWYMDSFGKPPDYSDLLKSLARTPAERQQLLRSYWEPTQDERVEGIKQPTVGHRAIAALAAQGFIRVIITTNFDRLLESALSEGGIVPTVLSTPDQVHGALPLIHTRCCIFKVHGDYLDTRIRNTPAELETYPGEFDELLDRIFNEFGLIVCGWSAQWDPAMRAALFRAGSRRFSTYWTRISEPDEQAKRLINHRGAEVVPIEDSDSFFDGLRRTIEALARYGRPHPLSTEAAVASLKRYLSEPKYRIQLSDLVDEVVGKVLEATSTEAFATRTNEPPTPANFTRRVRAYEAACSTLLALAPFAGYWSGSGHFPPWQRALQRLGSVSKPQGRDDWIRLQRYPATLLLYGLGVGAVAAGHPGFLAPLFRTAVRTRGEDDKNAIEVLPPFQLFEKRRVAKLLEDMDSRAYAPLNDWIYQVLRKPARQICPTDDEFTYVFDKVEVLMALSFGEIAERDDQWMPLGAFVYRRRNRRQLLEEIKESIHREGEDSPYVKASVFGATADECLERVTTLESFVRSVPWS